MDEREEKMESEMKEGKLGKWEQGMCNGVYGTGELITTYYSQPCRHEIMQDGKRKHTHTHLTSFKLASTSPICPPLYEGMMVK